MSAPPPSLRAAVRTLGRYRRASRTVAAAALLYAIGLADEDTVHTSQLLHVHAALFQSLQTGALDRMITCSVTRIVTRIYGGYRYANLWRLSLCESVEAVIMRICGG